MKVLQILLGIIIIVLSYWLFNSIDRLELYFYSFPAFSSFNFTAVFTRLFMAFLVFLGFSLTTGLASKKLKVFSGIILFSLAIIFTLSELFGLMNHFIHLPYFFIGKEYSLNILLLFIGLILFIMRSIPIYFPFKKYQNWLLSFVFIGITTAIIILSAPDFLLYSKVDKVNKSFVVEELKEESKETLEKLNINKKQIIGFVSPSCSYCQKSGNKISLIAKKNNLIKKITLVITGEQEGIDFLYEKNNIENIPYFRMDAEDLLKISNKSIPYYIVVEDGNIIYEFGYRNMNENQIVEILRNN